MAHNLSFRIANIKDLVYHRILLSLATDKPQQQSAKQKK